jgi:hypothetical protein
MKSPPHSDISTGKIFGCIPGTRSWFHEKGHIEFNNLESTSALKLWQIYAFGFWMVSVTLSAWNKFMTWISILCLMFVIGIEIYEENWCNKYAENKLKKLKNKPLNKQFPSVIREKRII